MTDHTPTPQPQRRTFEVPEGFEAVRDAHGRATGEIRPKATARQLLHDVPCLINPEPASPILDMEDAGNERGRLLAAHYMDALTAILLEEDLAAIHELAEKALSSNPAPPPWESEEP